MPVMNADGCPINVQVEGPDGAPVLMLRTILGIEPDRSAGAGC